MGFVEGVVEASKKKKKKKKRERERGLKHNSSVSDPNNA